MQKRLEKAGVSFREVVVYESSVDRVPPIDAPPDWVIFFSPRVMGTALEWAWPWSDIRIGAVGTTAGRRASERGIAAATAPYHDPEALVEGMLSG